MHTVVPKICHPKEAFIGKFQYANSHVKGIYPWMSNLRRLRKISKATVMSVCLSVCKEYLCSHWTEYHEIWYLSNFRKSVGENLSFITIWQKMTGNLHEDVSTIIMIYLCILLILRNISDQSCIENQNTHFMFNNSIFFPTNLAVYKVTWKIWYSRTGNGWQYAHAHCMLDNYGYRPTLIVFCTHCFSTKPWLRERASVLRYTCFACLVLLPH